MRVRDLARSGSQNPAWAASGRSSKQDVRLLENCIRLDQLFASDLTIALGVPRLAGVGQKRPPGKMDIFSSLAAIADRTYTVDTVTNNFVIFLPAMPLFLLAYCRASIALCKPLKNLSDNKELHQIQLVENTIPVV